MMHGHEKSRSAIVAVKPTNKAERSAAESVERRAETKGNVDQQRTRRTQRRIRARPNRRCRPPRPYSGLRYSSRIGSEDRLISILLPSSKWPWPSNGWGLFHSGTYN